MEDEYLRSYAIKYLDNGGKYDEIPAKNNRIKKVVENEEKRRNAVYIRYGMQKSASYSKDVLKEIKKKETILENPNNIYYELTKLSIEKLKNLKKKSLQVSKSKK